MTNDNLQLAFNMTYKRDFISLKSLNLSTSNINFFINTNKIKKMKYVFSYAKIDLYIS